MTSRITSTAPRRAGDVDIRNKGALKLTSSIAHRDPRILDAIEAVIDNILAGRLAVREGGE